MYQINMVLTSKGVKKMENLISEDFILRVIGGQALRIEQLSVIIKELQEKNKKLEKEIADLKKDKKKEK